MTFRLPPCVQVGRGTFTALASYFTEPTLPFKDFGAQFMLPKFNEQLSGISVEIKVFVSTSGLRAVQSIQWFL